MLEKSKIIVVLHVRIGNLFAKLMKVMVIYLRTTYI